jgi:hypothetical protein
MVLVNSKINNSSAYSNRNQTIFCFAKEIASNWNEILVLEIETGWMLNVATNGLNK